MNSCYLIMILCCLLPSSLQAQLHDNHWITAKLSNSYIHGNDFDFATSPHTVTAFTGNYEVGGYNCTMSDAAGNLIFYSNGVKIMNAQHEVMENGDSINWGPYAQLNLNDFYNIVFLSIPIPSPGSDSLYYMVYGRIEFEGGPIGYTIKDWLYSKIDMSKNGGLGKVVEKDQLIGSGFAIFTPNACRHANGRDWWVTAQEDSASLYYRCLLTPEGFVGFDTQHIGYKPPFPEEVDFGGQNVFSPDGRYYIDYDALNGARIFDFDRCTGLLSNFRYFPTPFSPSEAWGLGAAFSPNSQYLYITGRSVVLQYRMDAPDIAATVDTVAVFDGFAPTPLQPADFSFMQPEHDGKIYFIPGGTSRYVHCITNPNEAGDACNVVQRYVEAPNLFRQSLPTFPNYRLYDLPGSPCDTLGIDGPPVAVQEREWPEAELVIYPNPVSEMLYLNTVAATSQPVEVILNDMNGREVLRRAHPLTVRSYGLRLPALAAGMYVVSVRLRDGRVLGETVVVGRE